MKSRPGSNGRSDNQMVIYGLIAVTTCIELCLTAADLGWIGSPYWRGTSYGYGAFYTHLLRDWTGNFPGQPATMFVTYAFLHAGWLHLLVNMMALASFGTNIVQQVGATRFLIAYFACAIGGAAFYGVMSTSSAPAVGASGALFGLLGIWICWGYLDRRHYGEGMKEIVRALVILVLYNIAFYFLLSGNLAWEIHLGGFVTGWVFALFWGRQVYQRRRKSSVR